ncbi:MAG TPA: hypothetical protein PK605_01965 [Ignavibacteria bacterium]|nr:hypothetical protein [Ignavibacteria bacterium]HRF67197.1 hypothetical protein [Ignavibacteria bacterium]HRJ03148.1 hypothetical protein [Ignavibacteria bacterium]HRJ87040.1 hypothetical protein [Ignavibacteria bacterium]
MITLKMKNHDIDHYESLIEMLPVIITLLGVLIANILYFIYD